MSVLDVIDGAELYLTTYPLARVEAFPVMAELIGASPVTERARSAVLEAAGRSEPILISAEAGLDPVAIARAIHDASARAAGVFVTVDCARHDTAELERALFGGPSKAPFDALESIGPAGLLRGAFGGTMVLANFEGLPSGLQSRLARLLRDRQVVDSRGHEMPLDVRCVATTLGNVEEETRDGKLRQELCARFSLRVDVPPLRLRAADIPTLVACLAADVSRVAGCSLPTFSREALTLLAALPWRRNLEELREVLSGVVMAASGGVVGLEEILSQMPLERASAPQPGASSLRGARVRFEREYIAAVLHRHQWRIDDAARTLGIQRTNLHRKLRQLGIARARTR